MKTLIVTLLLSTLSLNTFASQAIERLMPSEKRIDHARELLGKRYKKSIVSNHEQQVDLEKNILDSVIKGLPKKFKSEAESVALAILTESAKHGFDPYFVMAVVSGESSFNPMALGPVGEIGLMQIRASTGEWMAKRMKMKWRGEKTLRDPVTNIKLGTAYLAWLREKFDNHGQLYLAAYNMGPKSVKTALTKNIWPKDYPIHVMKRYLAYYRSI